jgi:hypothetical protein
VSEAKAEEAKPEKAQVQAQQEVKEGKAETAQVPQPAQAQPQEVKEIKAEAPKPNEEVVKELDALVRLLLWASKNKARVFAAINEISKNREKLINVFAEAPDPNIFEFVVQAMSKFGLVQVDKLPKPRECPECRQSKEELEETLKQVIDLFNNKEILPEKKPIAIEKAKKVYGLDCETRVEYLKTALQKTIEEAERNPMDGLMFFLKWLIIDTGPAAYDGTITYPFMARPQYREAWVKVVVAFMAFVNNFVLSFLV